MTAAAPAPPPSPPTPIPLGQAPARPPENAQIAHAVAPTRPPGPVRTEIVAHRGASSVAPENTLAAVREAVAVGADWCEVDGSLTADNEVVLLHDAEVDRTTNGHGPVAQHTAAALQRLDAGSWFGARFAGEPVPTLRQALAVAGGDMGMLVEIKTYDPRDHELAERLPAALGAAGPPPLRPLEPATLARWHEAILASGSRTVPLTRGVIAAVREQARQARQAGLPMRVALQSFSPIACALAVCEAPELPVELLAWRLGPRRYWPREPDCWAAWLRLAGLNPDPPGATHDRLATLRAAGRTMSVWTVNDRPTMRRLIRRGVDRLITDRPDWARQEAAVQAAPAVIVPVA